MDEPKPLAECPDHLDELPEFDPTHHYSCPECGYVCFWASQGDRYGGDDPENPKYPIITDHQGRNSYFGWVEDWVEIHFCDVCQAEFETTDGT